MLIHAATAGDRNAIKKEAQKILKHKALITETQRMCNVKKVIPVITGATGTTSKSFRKYLSNIPGKHEPKELQKPATPCINVITTKGTGGSASSLTHSSLRL
jgi:hypothetical protein